MRKKKVKVIVAKEDYFKVMDIVNTYADHGIKAISSRDNISNEVVFACGFTCDRLCLHDLNLAKKLGLKLEIEVI